MQPALASTRRAMDGFACPPPQGLCRQALDLSALARQVMDELCEAEPLREVRVYIEPDLMVQGDPALLQQVLQALLALGYSEKEALLALKQIPPETNVSDGIRMGLKYLSKA